VIWSVQTVVPFNATSSLPAIGLAPCSLGARSTPARRVCLRWIGCFALQAFFWFIAGQAYVLGQRSDPGEVPVEVEVQQLSQEAMELLQKSPAIPGQLPILPSPHNAQPTTNPNSKLIPIAQPPQGPGQVQLQVKDNWVHLTTRNATVAEVLAMISSQMGLNIVTAEDLNQRVNVTLNGVLLEDALNAILSVNGLVWARQNNIITISTADPEKKLAPNVQGKAIQVFTLNYAMGEDINQVILGLLSPIGKSYVIKISQDEQRAAREQLIVEDLPPYIERIAQYISQVDIAPRQVVVEAHILQVALKDTNRHGVNFNQIARISNSRVNIQTLGFATEAAPVAAMEIEGTDLTGWLECLKSTADTKTLASPKVAVVNGQEAKISVGGKLGYLLTTATQTAALQSVSFLDYGVMLTVLPIITEDGRVLMKVTPQVSTARINTTSKLPESEATEVTTYVMLNDGQAIVIGGLIKEEKNDNQSKIPFFGDIPLLGKLFRARSLVKERSEIIIALLPRIAVPGDCESLHFDPQVVQASTPIMDRNLNPIDRSAWEGEVIGAAEKRKRWWQWGSHGEGKNTAQRPFDAAAISIPNDEPAILPERRLSPPIGFSPSFETFSVPAGANRNQQMQAAPSWEPSLTDIPLLPVSSYPSQNDGR
jgi:type IV pilus assembly protein PilQ